MAVSLLATTTPIQAEEEPQAWPQDASGFACILVSSGHSDDLAKKWEFKWQGPEHFPVVVDPEMLRSIGTDMTANSFMEIPEGHSFLGILPWPLRVVAKTMDDRLICLRTDHNGTS